MAMINDTYVPNEWAELLTSKQVTALVNVHGPLACTKLGRMPNFPKVVMHLFHNTELIEDSVNVVPAGFYYIYAMAARPTVVLHPTDYAYVRRLQAKLEIGTGKKVEDADDSA